MRFGEHIAQGAQSSQGMNNVRSPHSLRDNCLPLRRENKNA